MAADVNDKPIIEDPVYFAKRGGLYALGKNVVHMAEHPVGEIVQPLIETVSKTTPDFVNNITALLPAAIRHSSGALVVGVGLTAAISAGLTQMDYIHKRDEIKNLYKEELAAKLNKSPDKVTAADLDAFSKENHTVSEALRKSGRQRNFGLFMSIVASMVAMTVVKLVVEPLIMVHIPEEIGALAKGIAEVVIRGLAGLGTYLAVKTPLHWLGDKLFDLDEKTAHDKIAALSREHEAGNLLSPAQILSVFVEAHPKLEEFIAEKYGASFDKLPLAAKQQAVEDLSQMLPLKQLAHDINSGKVNVGELAFAVEGDVSGVQHDHMPAHKKPNILERAVARFEHFFHKKSHVAAFAALPGDMPGNTVVTYEEHAPAKGGFVQRLGLTQVDTRSGYQQHIEQQRVQAEASIAIAQS